MSMIHRMALFCGDVGSKIVNLPLISNNFSKISCSRCEVFRIVGAAVGVFVGEFVGDSVGDLVVGEDVGNLVGLGVGLFVGDKVCGRGVIGGVVTGERGRVGDGVSGVLFWESVG